MRYSILENEIYQNSRYELIKLLEDICATEYGKFETIEAFNKVAISYEHLIDECFPKIPLSEERLAIFSRVYSDNGFISEALVNAIQSGDRRSIFDVLIVFDLQQDLIEESLQKRRFYEAKIFSVE